MVWACLCTPRPSGVPQTIAMNVCIHCTLHRTIFPYVSRHLSGFSKLDRSADQYEREGYSGVMYFFRTKNMMRAEDELLEYPGTHNVHEWSGAQPKPGYVYVIKGRKYPLKRGRYRNYRRY